MILNKHWKRILLFLLVCTSLLAVLRLRSPRLIQNAYASVLDTKASGDRSARRERCREYESYAWRLNDSVHQYLEASYLGGIQTILKRAREIDALVHAGTLIPIRNSSAYIIDTLWYSYPFLTPGARDLLDEIGTSFRYKLKNTHLKETRFVVTSVLRTTSSVNRNSIRHSAHLHGTTFDISYEEFDHPRALTQAENEYLREVLALTLYELREERKCWATYEMWQTCFHVVSR